MVGVGCRPRPRFPMRAISPTRLLRLSRTKSKTRSNSNFNFRVRAPTLFGDDLLGGEALESCVEELNHEERSSS